MMKPTLSTSDATAGKADLLVVILDDRQTLAQTPRHLAAVVADARKRFDAQTLKRELLLPPARAGQPHLLVCHTALAAPFAGAEAVRIIVSRALEAAADHGLRRIAVSLDGVDGGAFVGAASDGLVLGHYRQTAYRSGKSTPDPTVTIQVRAAARRSAGAILRRGNIVAEQVNACRDLVNEPGAALTPRHMAQHGRRLCARYGLRCTVLNEAQLIKQGYRGIVTVGQGSPHRPSMVIMGYRPARPSKHHLALVGKGVTFDTGGISLKRAEGMWTMKGDMAGAGAVMHAMAAIAQLRPSVRVTGIVATAENAIGSRAMRPGDILRARNGKTVMVDNTDAEGRLVLTDALHRAGKEKASHIVDLATLTGACVRALGPSVAGVMGNDPTLVRQIIDRGHEQGEMFWELPLVSEYADALRTPGADLKNVGGIAGAITAGLFLQEFVPEGAGWAHLDIAGPAHMDRRWKHYREGATGFGVKSIVALCEQWS